jgi:phage gpG-like protein
MITVEVAADSALLRLERAGEQTRAGLAREVGALTQQLVDLIRQKLSGSVLNERSGRLRDSVAGRVIEGAGAIQGSVSCEGVPYAAVHEFGGESAYPIVPSSAQALAFMVGGRLVFARYVNHPPAKERSFMRSSFDDMRDEIAARLTVAARAGAEAA